MQDGVRQPQASFCMAAGGTSSFSSIQMFHLLPVHQNELKRMYFFVCGDFLPLESIFVFISEQFGRVMEYIIPQTPLFHGLLASAVGCNSHRWIT